MTLQQPNLRPLSAREILYRAFRLYRAHLRLFIGITGVLLVPLGIVQVLALVFFQNTNLVVPLQIFLYFLLFGALAWAASRVYLGFPASIGDAYQASMRRLKSLLGAFFLLAFAAIPAVFLVFLGAMGGGIRANTVFDPVLAVGLVAAGALVGGLLALPYLIFLSIRWAVYIPGIIIEGIGANAGLRRSWSLTSKDKLHVFGTLVIPVLLVYLVALLPGILLGYTLLGALISMPLSISASVILYYDLRVRREGYDLELAIKITTEEPAISGEQGLPNPEQGETHVP